MASALVALNWHRLNRQWMAVSAWLLGAVQFVFQNELFELYEWPWPWPWIVGFLVWFPLIGLPQVLHFQQRFGGRYTKRGWLLPISIGIAIQILYVVLIRALFQPAQTPTPEQVIQSTSQASAQPAIYPAEEVAAAYAPYVFQVQVVWKERGGLLWLSWKDYGLQGSAVLIANSAKAGLLVTNRHVIAPLLDGSQAASISVRLRDQDAFIPARLVATAHQGLDLALLQIDWSAYKPYALHAGKAETLHAGESCIAIGNALGAGNGVTAGVFSKLDTLEGVNLLRTSTPVSHGNSGGALITLTNPRLIGIVSASISEGQNFNYAIPVDYVLGEGTWLFGEGQEEARSLFQQFKQRNP